MLSRNLLFALTSLVAVEGQQIVNGQIFTPGIAIIDSPQPNTPLGGSYLQVAVDISSNGQLQLPPYPSDPISAFYNITIFLTSYTTGWNFTISNGSTQAGNSGLTVLPAASEANNTLGEIMLQEPGSNVKHVNWIWPDCLVGSGDPSGNSSRGLYNISIHQNFRLNNTDAYTIFDLPIQVTNSIPEASNRPSCAALNNTLWSPEALSASANNFTRIPGTAIQSKGSSQGGQGLGAGEMVTWRTKCHSIWIIVLALMVVL